MSARRTAFWGLLTAMAALGRPAAIAPRPPAALDLRATRTLVAVDAWEGFSSVSPTRATYLWTGSDARQERALIEAVRNDPEAQRGHARYPVVSPLTPARRPRHAGGEAWFARDSTITVDGRSYRKHGLPRVVGLHEITPYATYRGVPVFRERGLEGTPEILYVPVHASCEVQPYVFDPWP